jgi:hypothetical protein
MAARFLGVELSPVELAHGPRLTAFLARHPQALSGYTFATLIAWRGTFQYEWALIGNAEEALLISCVLPGEESRRHLLQPVGTLTRETAQLLLREAAALDYPLRIVGVTDRFLEENPELLAHFDRAEDRATANYIYRAADLAELKGSRYSKKRNMLHQAEGLYRWSAEPLTPGHVPACRELLAELDEPAGDSVWTPAEPDWSSAPAGGARVETVSVLDRMRLDESAALDFTLEHLAELDQQGIVVSVEGRPAAFSIFEPQSPGTAVVHFERAARARKGLYQLVNKVAAREIAARGFELLNREEDLGDPGLRQAKSSYHPAHLARAWTLTAKAA